MTKAVDEVVIHPDEVLRTVCEPAGKVDGALRELGARMASTMIAAGGIGLAAPQIGVSTRACVVRVSSSNSGFVPVVLFDPEITWRSKKFGDMAEGCLSIPGKRFLVRRPKEVRVRYFDIDGNENEFKMTGMLARCVQHEIDHLNGVLILDHGEEIEIQPEMTAP